VEPVNGGSACEQTSETQGCNIGSCDVDCVLSGWSAWSVCSKACGGGVQSRSKTVESPAYGMGRCWEASDDERLDHKDCDPLSCDQAITDPTRELLQCHSKVDVVIVVDGSGSLGWYGWRMSKYATEKLVDQFSASSDAEIAVLVYGGPHSMAEYLKCAGLDKSTAVNMETECRMIWKGHLTDDIATVKANVAAMEWPRSTTMTSLALSEAERELFKGRDDAESVVILITDGWPMSRTRTNVAAAKLQQVAKVLYVPVGYSAPRDLIEQMASKPKSDHIIQANTLWELSQPHTLNNIIGSTCLSVS